MSFFKLTNFMEVWKGGQINVLSINCLEIGTYDTNIHMIF